MNDSLIVIDRGIEKKIYSIRGIQIMLDEDLATLYSTSTMRLNEQVKRNKLRFPGEFCFQLTKEEYTNLISQIAISSLRSQIVTSSYGGRRKLPFVFTEQGIAMLSAVLKSDVAVHMSIRIMTAFVTMRKTIQSHAELFSRLDHVEQKQIEHKLDTDKKFEQVFDALSSKDRIPEQKLFFEGQVFDAHKFVSDLIRSARKQIILIDNFVDDAVLNLFTKRRRGVQVIIYTKAITSSLSLDLAKYNQQYPAITVKELSSAHDRFLIIDKSTTYHFGASIKDLGKKLFAVSRFDKHALSLLRKLPTS